MFHFFENLVGRVRSGKNRKSTILQIAKDLEESLRHFRRTSRI